jgi:hypothetical protein
MKGGTKHTTGGTKGGTKFLFLIHALFVHVLLSKSTYIKDIKVIIKKSPTELVV